jgi:hypothetical protein
MILPLGLRIKRHELLGRLLVCPFDESRTFEAALIPTSQPHRVECAMLSKEGLNIELS